MRARNVILSEQREALSDKGNADALIDAVDLKIAILVEMIDDINEDERKSFLPANPSRTSSVLYRASMADELQALYRTRINAEIRSRVAADKVSACLKELDG